MKISGTKNKTKYREFCEGLKKNNIPNNMLLFLKDKILLEDIIKIISKKFIGETDSKDNIKHYFSDGKNIEEVINECSNINFFTERKIIVYKIVKKPGVRGIPKVDKAALLNYLKNSNPDIILLMVVTDKDYNLNNFKEFVDLGVPPFIFADDSEKDMISWIKEKFDGYQIDEQTILYLLQFLNVSYDEVITEVEKIKTYCAFSKEVTEDVINLCVGISKDFSENDFIEAVFSRDKNRALKIYENLSLKEDVEIYLLVLLNSAYIAMSKLLDPETKRLKDWDLRKELRLWTNAEKMLSVYKNYSREINELKLMSAFDYIYKAEKAFKSTNTDKKTVFTSLINKLSGL